MYGGDDDANLSCNAWPYALVHSKQDGWDVKLQCIRYMMFQTVIRQRNQSWTSLPHVKGMHAFSSTFFFCSFPFAPFRALCLPPCLHKKHLAKYVTKCAWSFHSCILVSPRSGNVKQKKSRLIRFKFFLGIGPPFSSHPKKSGLN